MIADSRGIVLQQVKTVNSRRILQLFTERFGKVSVGVTVNERGKGRGGQALHPFTYGQYELFSSRGYYNLNKGQVLHSFYDLGADIDKYMAAAYGLELCNKLLEEEQPAPELFALTLDFLESMEKRKSRFETLLLAYKVKLLDGLGLPPMVDACVNCGKTEDLIHFSISAGGATCASCAGEMNGEGPETSLLYEVDFVILSVLEHFLTHSIASLEKMALEESIEERCTTIIDRFIAYHLDPGELKAGSVRIDGTEGQTWKSH